MNHRSRRRKAGRPARHGVRTSQSAVDTGPDAHRSLAHGLAAAATVASLLLATPAAAEDPLGRHVGLGALSATCTLVYTPAKILYAAGGTAVAGLVYLWTVGDTEATKQVLRVTAGGDYVITREHLRGLRVLRFAG